MTPARITHRLLLVILGIGLFDTLSQAQPCIPSDPIAEAQARQRIADQKAEADVLSAIKGAERQAKSNVAKAVQMLKAAQINIIDFCAYLSEDARKTLTGKIDGKLALLEGKPVPKTTPKTPAPKYNSAKAYEDYTAELTAIDEGIQKIIKSKGAGQTKVIDEEIASLGKSFPNNPAVIRLSHQDKLDTRIDEAKVSLRQQEKQIRLMLGDIRTNELQDAAEEFPRNGKPGGRVKVIQLPEKEQKLLNALDKNVTIDWVGKKLDAALQEVAEKIDLKLDLNKKALNDAGIDFTKTVPFEIKDMKANTALRRLLVAQNLTFVLEDEVIQVGC